MQKEHKLLILKIALMVFLLISVMDKNIYADGRNLVPSKSTEFQLWLQQKAPQLQQRYGATGAAIGVVQGGETTYTLNMGYANKKDRIPVTTSTVFQAGSVSKTITALGILHLVDQGALSLDDPVSKYLTRWHFPSSPYDLENVTVRSLLSHTAGLPAHPGYLGVKPGDKLSSLEESLSGLGESGVKTYVAQQPGKFAVYSGAGYTLLQLLIEEVTGLSFDTYMQQQILDPLGMISSSFDPSELNSGKAAGYGYFGQKLPDYRFTEQAAAGLKTNVKDLMSLMMAEMKPYKAGMVLQNMLLIKERQKPVLDENGLGVFVRKLPDQRRLIYHSGDNRGFHSFYGYIPESGDGLVILTNSDNGIDLRQDIYSAWIKFQTGEDAPGYLALKQKREINRYLAAVLYLLLGCYIAVAAIRLIRGRRGFISKHARKVKWIFALKAVLTGGVGISLVYYTYFLSILNLAAGLKQVVMAVFLWLIGLLLVAIFPKYRKRKQSM